MLMEHGTTTAYTKHKCRCDKCKAANRVAVTQWRARNPEKDQAARKRARVKERSRQQVLERLADENIERYLGLLGRVDAAIQAGDPEPWKAVDRA